MSSDTKDTGGLGMHVVCKYIPLFGKHTNKISKDSVRKEDQ